MRVSQKLAMKLRYIVLGISFALRASLAQADDRNLLPKYGGLPETEWQKAANAAFISGMDEDYTVTVKRPRWIWPCVVGNIWPEATSMMLCVASIKRGSSTRKTEPRFGEWRHSRPIQRSTMTL